MLLCLHVYRPLSRDALQLFSIWLVVWRPLQSLQGSEVDCFHLRRFAAVGRVSTAELRRNFIVPTFRSKIKDFHVASWRSALASSRNRPCRVRDFTCSDQRSLFWTFKSALMLSLICSTNLFFSLLIFYESDFNDFDDADH